MTRTLVIRREARLELLEAAEWYAERSRGLGGEFVRVIDAAIASVVRSPLQYPIIDAPIRRAVVRRFPYAIFFTANDERVVILAIFHVRRDPEEWKDRV